MLNQLFGNRAALLHTFVARVIPFRLIQRRLRRTDIGLRQLHGIEQLLNVPYRLRQFRLGFSVGNGGIGIIKPGNHLALPDIIRVVNANRYNGTGCLRGQGNRIGFHISVIGRGFKPLYRVPVDTINTGDDDQQKQNQQDCLIASGSGRC